MNTYRNRFFTQCFRNSTLEQVINNWRKIKRNQRHDKSEESNASTWDKIEEDFGNGGEDADLFAREQWITVSWGGWCHSVLREKKLEIEK